MHTKQEEVTLSPDPTITVQNMQEYGYDWNGMLPLQETIATLFFEKNDIEIFCLYGDNSEGSVENIEDLRSHAERGGIFGVEKDAWNDLIDHSAASKADKQRSNTSKEKTSIRAQLKEGNENAAPKKMATKQKSNDWEV